MDNQEYPKWPDHCAARVLVDQESLERYQEDDGLVFLMAGDVCQVESDEGDYLIVTPEKIQDHHLRTEAGEIACVPLYKKDAIPVPNFADRDPGEDLPAGQVFVGDLLNDGMTLHRILTAEDIEAAEQQYEMHFTPCCLFINQTGTVTFYTDTPWPTILTVAEEL